MTDYRPLVDELRSRKILDAKDGLTRSPSDLELKAAEAIESLSFQLSCRIGVARAEEKERLNCTCGFPGQGHDPSCLALKGMS